MRRATVVAWPGGSSESSGDLLDSALLRRVSELLARAGLSPEALILEITEAMLMADLTRSERVIESLAGSGILVSIDHLGTGFSSLAHRNNLAVGELKLDRIFTSRLQVGEASGRDEDLVRSIIHLGHALGLRVVAEASSGSGSSASWLSLGVTPGRDSQSKLRVERPRSILPG